MSTSTKDFLKEIEQCYKDDLDYHDHIIGKLEWLGNIVFDFVTYDANMDRKWAQKMIEVLSCIIEGKTFDYQDKSQDNYENYLTMVNMDFLSGLLDWGTSIRGAWIEIYGNKKFDFVNGRIDVDQSELKDFINSIILFSKS